MSKTELDMIDGWMASIDTTLEENISLAATGDPAELSDLSSKSEAASVITPPKIDILEEAQVIHDKALALLGDFSIEHADPDDGLSLDDRITALVVKPKAEDDNEEESKELEELAMPLKKRALPAKELLSLMEGEEATETDVMSALYNLAKGQAVGANLLTIDPPEMLGQGVHIAARRVEMLKDVLKIFGLARDDLGVQEFNKHDGFHTYWKAIGAGFFHAKAIVVVQRITEDHNEGHAYINAHTGKPTIDVWQQFFAVHAEATEEQLKSVEELGLNPTSAKRVITYINIATGKEIFGVKKEIPKSSQLRFLPAILRK